MSKQVMQKALESLTLARSQLDVLWVSHHANRTDAALESADAAIAELRAAIDAPEVEPVAWVLFRKDEDGLEPVQFYGGKEKPEGEFKDRFELRPVHVSPPDTEAMRRDAERYQWWVKTMTSENAMDIISDMFRHLPHDTVPTEQQFGEVIDAAIAQGGGV